MCQNMTRPNYLEASHLAAPGPAPQSRREGQALGRLALEKLDGLVAQRTQSRICGEVCCRTGAQLLTQVESVVADLLGLIEKVMALEDGTPISRCLYGSRWG